MYLADASRSPPSGLFKVKAVTMGGKQFKVTEWTYGLLLDDGTMVVEATIEGQFLERLLNITRSECNRRLSIESEKRALNEQLQKEIVKVGTMDGMWILAREGVALY